MAYLDDQRSEIHLNFAAFQASLPSLLRDHEGGFAVFRHAKLMKIFDNYGTALAYCGVTFDDRLFSIQEITSESLVLESRVNADASGPLRSSGRAYR